MPEPASPYEIAPPPPRTLWRSVALAAIGAAVVLVAVVLPAEYGIDPTGVGRALGLTALDAPARTIEIRDVIGGNETVREVQIPDAGEPVPLPNPAVYQDEAAPPQTRTLEIRLEPDQETEVKTVLREGKMLLYTWKVDRGDIYTDFHGHDPALGPDFWVRYEELDGGGSSSGSLVAPFAGEHGWFWLNYNEFPVVITLTVSGYFDDVVDYGVH